MNRSCPTCGGTRVVGSNWHEGQRVPVWCWCAIPTETAGMPTVRPDAA